MNISLSQDTQQFVDAKVKSGEYRSASEVVEEALRVMRELPAWTTEDLRREIAIGIEQLERGDGEPWDVEAMKAQLTISINARG